MYYSKTTNGFYDPNIHGGQMPDDVVEITLEEHAALLDGQSTGKRIVSNMEGHPVLVDPPAPLPPTVVTMRQARLALLAAGKLDAVGVAIANLPSPQRQAALIEWDYASTVERDSAFVGQLGGLLGLDAPALDDLFMKASKL